MEGIIRKRTVVQRKGLVRRKERKEKKRKGEKDEKKEDNSTSRGDDAIGFFFSIRFMVFR